MSWYEHLCNICYCRCKEQGPCCASHHRILNGGTKCCTTALTSATLDTKLDLSKWNTNELPPCKHWHAKLSLDNHKYCSVMLCSHKKPLHDIVIKAESHSLTTQAELYEDNVWESARTSPQNRKKHDPSIWWVNTNVQGHTQWIFCRS